MKPEPIPEGTPCTLNGARDSYMNGDMVPFFHAPIEVVRVTKSGFVQVRMINDPKRTCSVPRYNVDLTP